MKKIVFLIIMGMMMAGCGQASIANRLTTSVSGTSVTDSQPRASASLQAKPQVTVTPELQPLLPATPQPSLTAGAIPTPVSSAMGGIPNFDHIILIVLENEYLQDVVGSEQMPKFNALASKYVLLSDYFALGHPSLPNYLALVSGSTHNVTSDCTDCYLNQPNLADEIEASGRTWKAYLESMPSPCFVGNKSPYVQMDNPFIYFDSIRLDATRCKRSIVPLTQLDNDLSAGKLPNFAYIMPNICNSGHNCPAATADGWVASMVAKLQASPALGQNSLIIITFDEGVKKNGNIKTRGEVATVLISPLAHEGFNDPTSYSHYSLLKTILTAWNLPDLGETRQSSTQAIKSPWISPTISAVPPK